VRDLDAPKDRTCAPRDLLFRRRICFVAKKIRFVFRKVESVVGKITIAVERSDAPVTPSDLRPKDQTGGRKLRSFHRRSDRRAETTDPHDKRTILSVGTFDLRPENRF